MAREYRKIKAWKLVHELIIEIYKVTKDFPKDEIYGLTSQIRRATVSVNANIVEGASRNSKKDYVHFLYISRGSLLEAEYLLFLSNELHYLNDQRFQDLNRMMDECARTLYGLIRFLEEEVKE
jgi:four helix bundle protein